MLTGVRAPRPSSSAARADGLIPLCEESGAGEGNRTTAAGEGGREKEQEGEQGEQHLQQTLARPCRKQQRWFKRVGRTMA